MTSAGRHQLLAGVVPNLRDVGGLRVAGGGSLRRGRLLRSAALVELPPAALAAVTGAVPPGQYVDLRTDREVERDGAPTGLLRHGWRWHRLPLQDQPDGDAPALPDAVLLDAVVRRHVAAVPRYRELAARVAALLTEPPVVVACSLGKDRTGLVVAVLLHQLGVARADVLADFLASNECLRTGEHLLPPRWQRRGRGFDRASAAVCAAVLDRLGDPDPLDDTLARARSALVTPDAGRAAGTHRAAAARRRQGACNVT